MPPRRKSRKSADSVTKEWMRVGPGQVADERAVASGCTFDLARAQHAIEFIERYQTLTEGAFKGQPFKLLEWQRVFIGRLFGWVRYSEQWGQVVRRFRMAYLEVPKKNGKTPLLAAIGTYLLFADAPTRQVNVYLAATTRKQAERALMHAVRSIRNSEQLSDGAKIKKLEGFTSVEYLDNAWQVVAADPDSADGVNGHCLADEFHRWRGHEFTNTLRWMLATQAEGLFVAITTAGSDPESACAAAHEKTIAVNRGTQTDQQWLGEIYAADPTDDPHDEKTWFKANPSLGTGAESPIKLETFRADHDAAIADPQQWHAFAQLRLNLWRTSVCEWIDGEQWDAGPVARKAARKRIDCFEPFGEELPQNLKGACFLGLDVAAVWDTSSAVFATCDPTTEIVRLHAYYWLPRATAEKLRGRVPYLEWAEQGLLRLTDGDAVDYDTILSDLTELIDLHTPRAMFFDPLFQGEYLTQRIESETGIQRVQFKQTVLQFAPAVQIAERLITNRTLRHNGHPLLRWQVGNVRMKVDPQGNKRPVKQTERGKFRTIDGVVAAFMTLPACDAWAEDDKGDDDDDEELI